MKYFLILICLVSNVGWSRSLGPLETLDVSSPRALLFGFLEISTDIHARGVGVIKGYLDSDRLYMTPEERSSLFEVRREGFKLMPAIDLSALPQVTREESERRIMIQLKEILDRVELPASNDVPDAQMMKAEGKTRWVVPKTEIAIQQIESGPRKGDYVFSSDTIDRLQSIYSIAKSLPYVTTNTRDWYERQQQYPIGPMMVLAGIVPPRWVLNEISIKSSKIVLLHQPLWRWAAILILCVTAFVFGRYMFLLASRREAVIAHQPSFSALIRPVTVALLTFLITRVMSDVLRVSDEVFGTMVPALWAVLFLSLSWFFWALGEVISEFIIHSENMVKGSINSQLTRFVLRLLSFALVVGTLVVGGQSLGLPAYSIIASIGVGGLAVALAAQHTLANLLGSLIILFEKPFVVGSRVVAGGQTGRVRAIGFRSTQVEAANGAIISIPNDKMISGPIEADNSEPQNLLNATLVVHQSTPVVQIRTFMEKARDFLILSDAVREDSVFVGLSGLRDQWIDIKIGFVLSGPLGERVAERNSDILLALLDLARECEITTSHESSVQGQM